MLTLVPSSGGERKEQKSGGRMTRGGNKPSKPSKSGREKDRTKDSSGDKSGRRQ